MGGIPPAPRGIPQIEVTFDIDANGILNVTAKDRGTGKEAKVTITASTKLAKDDVDKMVKEAERFAQEDKNKREKIETVNQADTLIYTAEKTIQDLGDKVTTEERERVNNAVQELRGALKTEEMPNIKAKMEVLTKEISQVSVRIYQQAAQQGDNQPPNPPSGDEEKGKGDKGDFTDADFHIVD